jgi:hypothetical protein
MKRIAIALTILASPVTAQEVESFRDWPGCIRALNQIVETGVALEKAITITTGSARSVSSQLPDGLAENYASAGQDALPTIGRVAVLLAEVCKGLQPSLPAPAP